jgi:hypothetical protein
MTRSGGKNLADASDSQDSTDRRRLCLVMRNSDDKNLVVSKIHHANVDYVSFHEKL